MKERVASAITLWFAKQIVFGQTPSGRARMKFLLGLGRRFVGVLLLITVAYLIVDGDRLAKINASESERAAAMSPAR